MDTDRDTGTGTGKSTEKALSGQSVPVQQTVSAKKTHETYEAHANLRRKQQDFIGSDTLEPEVPVIRLPDLPLVACVDIGGSKVAVSLADAAGMRERVVQPTRKQGKATAVAEQVGDMIEQACAAAGTTVTALQRIGVATAGPLVRRGDDVGVQCPNLCGSMTAQEGRQQLNGQQSLPNDWDYVPLLQPLQQRFVQARTDIMMDAIAAMQAERYWGALQGVQHGAYVTWSTGVGAGICVNGQPLLGKQGNAGHLGHSYSSTSAGYPCGCGNDGDVEAVCGGRALTLRAQQVGYDSLAQMFAAAQHSGAADASHCLGVAIDTMGRALYNLVVLFDLERIVLGGSVFWHNRHYLLPALQSAVHSRLPTLTAGVELLPARLGQRVGDFAALAVVLHSGRV